MRFAIAIAAHVNQGRGCRTGGRPSGAACTTDSVIRLDVESASNVFKCRYETMRCYFIATAAVADWRPPQRLRPKIKTGPDRTPVEFDENMKHPIATVARNSRAIGGALFCVGFAARERAPPEMRMLKRKGRKGASAACGQSADQRSDLTTTPCCWWTLRVRSGSIPSGGCWPNS
jgi:phosphopantothenoylcysteine decarboxylase/phosphopantothenate--cysteine ligase